METGQTLVSCPRLNGIWVFCVICGQSSGAGANGSSIEHPGERVGIQKSKFGCAVARLQCGSPESAIIGGVMDLKQQFEAAATTSKGLPSQGNETLLELYSLYKQATEGDVQGEAPSGFDFRGAAKYAAWEKRRGMSSDEAMQAYIDLVDRLAAG
jgi:acyl-CoA-binding protein